MTPDDLSPYQMAPGIWAWLVVGGLHIAVPVVIVIIGSLRAVHAAVRANVAVVKDKPWYEEKVADHGDGKFEDLAIG